MKDCALVIWDYIGHEPKIRCATHDNEITWFGIIRVTPEQFAGDYCAIQTVGTDSPRMPNVRYSEATK